MIRHQAKLSIFLQGGVLALGLISSLILAGLMGPADFGKYSLIIQVTTILIVPLTSGIGYIVISDLPGVLLKGKLYVDFFLKAILFFYLKYSVIILIGCFVVKYFEFISIEPPLYLIFLLFFLMGGIGLLGSVLRSFGINLLPQFIEGMLKSLIFLICIGIYYLLFDNYISIYNVVAFQVISIFVCLVIMLYYLMGKYKIVSNDGGLAEHLISLNSKVLLFSISAILMALNQAASSFWLGYLQNVESVGIYKMAELCASAVAVPLSAVAVFFAGKVSLSAKQSNKRDLFEITQFASKIALIFALIGFFIFLVFGWYVFENIFGGKYADSYLPAVILCAAQVLNSASGIPGVVLNVAGGVHSIIKVVAVSLFISSLISLFSIPLIGIYGAALASLMSTMVWSFSLNHIMRLKFGFSSSIAAKYKDKIP